MCAILDASVRDEVFVPKAQRPEAGEGFFNWIQRGTGRLVIGGKLKKELCEKKLFLEWARQARLSGRLNEVNDNEVEARTKELENEGEYQSNDPHVLALAQTSGARLLYVNDRELEEDFKNKNLIDRPEGKLYLTRVSNRFPNANKFTDSKKRLLRNRNLCRPRE